MTTTRKRLPSLFAPVTCIYGAPLGRHNVTDLKTVTADDVLRFRVEKIRWTDGAYDQGGAYWGMGLPVYLAVFDNGEGDYIRRSYRAGTRAEVIRKLRGEFPNARTR